MLLKEGARDIEHPRTIDARPFGGPPDALADVHPERAGQLVECSDCDLPRAAPVRRCADRGAGNPSLLAARFHAVGYRVGPSRPQDVTSTANRD
jgi:hypothetical protein